MERLINIDNGGTLTQGTNVLVGRKGPRIGLITDDIANNDQPMRRLARWDDLPAASHALIQAMVDKRLLVKDTRDGQVLGQSAGWARRVGG
jgi:hypothetical protein